jgi:hypothetical protein
MLDQTNVAAARLLHLNFSLFKGSLLSANCCWMAWKRISWRWPTAHNLENSDISDELLGVIEVTSA